MRRPIIALTVVALALAGCGGEDEEPAPAAGGGGGGGGETLTISADPGGALKFDKAELQAEAGPVTIEMANPSDAPHAVAIEGGENAKPGETVTKDGTSTASAELAAGEYTYYCPVGGHREAGMEGKLTVR